MPAAFTIGLRERHKQQRRERILRGGGQTRHAWHATATDLAGAGLRAVTGREAS